MYKVVQLLRAQPLKERLKRLIKFLVGERRMLQDLVKVPQNMSKVYSADPC